jgi:hypothetical protein
MIGATKAIKTLIGAATTISYLAVPAYSQSFGKRGVGGVRSSGRNASEGG